MVYRKYPEMSAFAEGQREAEVTIEEVTSGYEVRGFSTPEEAIRHYGMQAYAFLLEKESGDPEHGQLLRGYLSTFD